MRWSPIATLLLAGCPPGKDTTTDNDTDGSDTGTALDTESTPTPPGSDLDGTWSGECEGDVTISYTYTTTSPSTYTYSYDYQQHIRLAGDLTLVEDPPGTVFGDYDFAGTITYVYTTPTTTSSTTSTTGSFELEGTRDGADVHLDAVGYSTTIYYSTYSTVYAVVVFFDLVLAGDSLDGDLVVLDYYGGRHELPCRFSRQ